MQELEKILEEIEQAKREPWYRLSNYDVKHKLDGAINRIVDIIRKHMNDGWIPVEERLPEEAGTYIVNALNGERDIVTFAKWQNRYKRFDMTGARAYWRIIAWRPLPEPYRPEPETEKPDWRQDMLRKFDRRE